MCYSFISFDHICNLLHLCRCFQIYCCSLTISNIRIPVFLPFQIYVFLFSYHFKYIPVFLPFQIFSCSLTVIAVPLPLLLFSYRYCCSLTVIAVPLPLLLFPYRCCVVSVAERPWRCEEGSDGVSRRGGLPPAPRHVQPLPQW